MKHGLRRTRRGWLDVECVSVVEVHIYVAWLIMVMEEGKDDHGGWNGCGGW
jgi:hypothetical protein